MEKEIFTKNISYTLEQPIIFVLNTYDADGFLGFVAQAFVMTMSWVLLCLAYWWDLPGHSQGKWWPLYVPEHYGVRSSQHLLDPYR